MKETVSENWSNIRDGQRFKKAVSGKSCIIRDSIRDIKRMKKTVSGKWSKRRERVRIKKIISRDMEKRGRQRIKNTIN